MGSQMNIGADINFVLFATTCGKSSPFLPEILKTLFSVDVNISECRLQVGAIF
jgi:hypothetical protein